MKLILRTGLPEWIVLFFLLYLVGRLFLVYPESAAIFYLQGLGSLIGFLLATTFIYRFFLIKKYWAMVLFYCALIITITIPFVWLKNIIVLIFQYLYCL